MDNFLRNGAIKYKCFSTVNYSKHSYLLGKHYSKHVIEEVKKEHSHFKKLYQTHIFPKSSTIPLVNGIPLLAVSETDERVNQLLNTLRSNLFNISENMSTQHFEQVVNARKQ
jgi:hypothetical protein